MHARRLPHSLAPKRRSTRCAGARALSAGVAQLAEHLFCKQVVGGSSPPASSILGGLPERPKGAGCKPAGIAYVGSNPTPSTDLLVCREASGVASHSQPEGLGLVFVCSGARCQALRPIRSVRAPRRARRLFVGGVASCADRDLVCQDSSLVPGSAGASPVFQPEAARPAALTAAGLFSAGKCGARGRVGGSPTRAAWILREIWGELARARKAVTMRGSSGMCAGEAFGGPPALGFPCGSSSTGRASAFQAERRGFESLLPLYGASGATQRNPARRIGWPT